MSKSPLGGELNSLFGRQRLGYQRVRPDARHGARSMGRNTTIAKPIEGAHAHTPLSKFDPAQAADRLDAVSASQATTQPNHQPHRWGDLNLLRPVATGHEERSLLTPLGPSEIASGGLRFRFGLLDGRGIGRELGEGLVDVAKRFELVDPRFRTLVERVRDPELSGALNELRPRPRTDEKVSSRSAGTWPEIAARLGSAVAQARRGSVAFRLSLLEFGARRH